MGQKEQSATPGVIATTFAALSLSAVFAAGMMAGHESPKLQNCKIESGTGIVGGEKPYDAPYAIFQSEGKVVADVIVNHAAIPDRIIVSCKPR